LNSAVASIEAAIAKNKIDTKSPGWRESLPTFPKTSFEGCGEILWKLETSVGDMTFRLRHDVAPNHVASTIWLTLLGFYDGLTFHRIIKSFMAQGGCPRGVGMGGPGYKYGGEFSPKAVHDRPGLLSMANAGPNTDGSQFFITFVPTAWLDGTHTIFGEMIENDAAGVQTLLALEAVPTASQDRPKTPVLIKKATIVAS
jgi:cyclophilin family peptidyl-prolyl cis-trans isomerase